MKELGDIALSEPAMAVYHMLASYPLATPVTVLAVVICFIFLSPPPIPARWWWPTSPALATAAVMRPTGCAFSGRRRSVC